MIEMEIGLMTILPKRMLAESETALIHFHY